MKCTICGNSNDTTTFQAKEMMYGSRETFMFRHCRCCDTVQMISPIANMSNYYPADYCSFSPGTTDPGERYKTLLGKLHLKRDTFHATGKGCIGRLLAALKPSQEYQIYKPLRLNSRQRILDIGSGNGNLLLRLSYISGLSNFIGIDPFIEKDICHRGGVRVFKKTIFETNGEWDIVMFHHSLEHMPNPKEVLQKAFSLLKKGGLCMISMPVCNSYAFRHYRENWVQLDAPRHLYIYSAKSCLLLAKEAGFRPENHCDNSSYFQFTGSELYKNDIPLNDPRSGNFFSRKKINGFAKRAKELNKRGKGDQSVFYLRKPE